MADKTRIFPTLDEKLVNDFKAVAEKMRWPFNTAVEIAFEQFIKQYGNTQLPGLAPIETASVEAPVKETI